MWSRPPLIDALIELQKQMVEKRKKEVDEKLKTAKAVLDKQLKKLEKDKDG